MRLVKYLKPFIIVIFLVPFAVSGQNTWQYYDSAANARLKKNDLQGALQVLNKGIQVDSGKASLYFTRGKLKASLNDYKGSISDFTRAIHLYPEAGSYYLRGISRYIGGDLKGAMSDFDSTVLYNADISYELYFFRGNIKFKQLDYNGSVEEYTKSIALKPNYAKAYYNRGVSKYYANLKGDACGDITKAKSIGFTDIDPLIRKYCDYYTTH